ncbi:MAG TPA: alcohol dehydrogenase catalytic domain-containing protein [Solirubrobacteraceae bacterium]|nr:alcohol dehydrogenase catalytic domain-containing protein [Solirubrobacteraceae bacterium]
MPSPDNTMRAVVLRAFNAPLELEERDIPTVRNGDESVVRVLACGICHSDLHVTENLFGSPLPLVLGHEIVAEDEQLGNVLVYAPWGCGECRFCRATEEMICPDGGEAGLFRDGGYAEYIRVPARRFLYPIGDLDPVQAAPLGCGGLTPYRAVKHARSWLGPDSRALVLGAGGLGQFGIQYLRLMTDAAVHVGDPSEQKRGRGLALGAEQAAAPEDLEGPYSAVLDFVGSEDSLMHAARLVDRQGIVIAIGLFGGRIPFGVGAIPHEARFMSSIWGSRDELAELIELAQREPLEYTIDTMPLHRAQEAHDLIRSGQARGRIVLTP